MLSTILLVALIAADPPIPTKPESPAFPVKAEPTIAAEPTTPDGAFAAIKSDSADITTYSGQVTSYQGCLQALQSSLDTSNANLKRHKRKLADLLGIDVIPDTPPKPLPPVIPPVTPPPKPPLPPHVVAKMSLFAVYDFPPESLAWEDSAVKSLMGKNDIAMFYMLASGTYTDQQDKDWIALAKRQGLPYISLVDDKGKSYWNSHSASPSDLLTAIGNALAPPQPSTSTPPPSASRSTPNNRDTFARIYMIGATWCGNCPKEAETIKAMRDEGYYTEVMETADEHRSENIEGRLHTPSSLPCIVICRSNKPTVVLQGAAYYSKETIEKSMRNPL